jgi:hypothetical protein
MSDNFVGHRGAAELAYSDKYYADSALLKYLLNFSCN